MREMREKIRFEEIREEIRFEEIRFEEMREEIRFEEIRNSRRFVSVRVAREDSPRGNSGGNSLRLGSARKFTQIRGNPLNAVKIACNPTESQDSSVVHPWARQGVQGGSSPD